MNSRFRRAAILCLLACVPGWFPQACAEDEPVEDDSLDIKVEICDGRVNVDVDLLIPAATPRQVWAVWTDYENLPRYSSSLKESHVVSQRGRVFELYQQGFSGHGPISFPYESHYQDEHVVPYGEIRSRLLRGSLQSMTTVTRFVAEYGMTRVLYHAESVPGVWMPPLVTKPFIEWGTRRHYQEMREEVMRRLGRGPDGANPVPETGRASRPR